MGLIISEASSPPWAIFCQSVWDRLPKVVDKSTVILAGLKKADLRKSTIVFTARIVIGRRRMRSRVLLKLVFVLVTI